MDRGIAPSYALKTGTARERAETRSSAIPRTASANLRASPISSFVSHSWKLHCTASKSLAFATMMKSDCERRAKMRSVQDFRIAIATHPTGKIDLRSEAEMVRSCILYAGHIRLYSPTATLLLQIAPAVENMSREEAAELVSEIAAHTSTSPVNPRAAALLSRAAHESPAKGWTKRAKQQRAGQKMLDASVAGMAKVAAGWSSTPAFMDLKLAEKHGILSFVREHPLERPMDQVADFVIAASAGRPRDGAEERSESYKEKVLAELFRAVTNDSEYPLLDRGIRELVRSGKAVGLQDSPTAKARSTAMGLGETIFSRLPVPDAPMDELLDLRRELSDVVSRFRGGLLKASAEIEGAQWDESFRSEASFAYERHVAPALEELEDLLRTTPALQKVFSLSASAAKSFGVVGGLYLVADKLLNLPPELGIALGLPAAVATFIFEQIMASQTRNQKARDNDWFLVYEARRKLENSSST